MDNKTVKQAGIFGVIAYVLSLPILIWKSSNFGKLIFTAGILAILIHSLIMVADKGLEYYKELNGIQYKVSEQKKYELEFTKLAEKIAKSKENLSIVNSMISTASKDIDSKVSEALHNALSEFRNELQDYGFKDKIKKIESSIGLIKEEERQALKQKIIEIKELVKIYEKSVDSVEIREVLEEIADNIYLLNDNEKSRMLNDLKEVGFKLNGIEKEVRNTRHFVTTGDSITMPFYTY